MMLKLLLVPAAALLVLGAEGLFFAAAAGKVISTTCDRIAAAPRSSPRLHVTGCELDYAATGYRQSTTGQIEELFVPARPIHVAAGPAPVVVAIHDPAVIAAAQTASASRTVPNDDAMRHAGAVLGLSNGIDGLARVGTIETFRTRRILSGFATSIAPGAIVIDLRGQPDYVRPALALAAGGLLAFIALRFGRRSTSRVRGSDAADADIARESRELNERSPAERTSAGEQPPLLPRLMLLNLDVTSGPDAVESAPALGARQDVIGILCGVIPDLVVDDRQRLLGRPDRSITLDLGTIDPVSTVVVEARGEGGAALVKELLLMTGWRAFAPKMGLFLGAHDVDAFGALAERSPSAVRVAKD
jgi:hypothetical protein